MSEQVVGEVVVAVEDDARDLEAIRWASREACQRGLPLRVVHTFSAQPAVTFGNHMPIVSSEMASEEQQFAEAVVRRAMHVASEVQPDVKVSGDTLAGPAINTLTAILTPSTLLVLGSHQLGATASHLLGSVGQYFTTHAPGPVIVVRPGLTGHSDQDRVRDRVTIAVNLAAPSSRALRFAFAEAQFKQLTLHAVGYLRRDWYDLAADHNASLPPHDKLSEDLSRILSPWKQQFPEVLVHDEVQTRKTAASLVQGSVRDELLVIERRTETPVIRAVVGTINDSVVHQSQSAVAVIPEEAVAPAPEHAPGTVRLREILVGVSGDMGSDRAALEWAADEASRRALPLHLVCAYHWSAASAVEATLSRAAEDSIMSLHRAAELAVTRAEELIGQRQPDVIVTGSTNRSDPAEALISQSSEASVVVVGSRQLQTVGTVLLGSVGAEVAARGLRPTVVVRGPDPLKGAPARVVVGVDAAVGSQELLAVAFEEASLRRCGLRVILAWEAEPRDLVRWRQAVAVAEQRAAMHLSEALAGWQERYPDVPVSHAVVRGRPAAALVAESHGETMLVIGSRPHGVLGGSLLRAVSQSVLHHATCPVMVIPTRDDR